MRDQQGNWIVSERREEDRRAGSPRDLAHARMVARRRLLLLVLLLILPALLVRLGIISTPSWLPFWFIYPEYAFAHMQVVP